MVYALLIGRATLSSRILARGTPRTSVLREASSALIAGVER